MPPSTPPQRPPHHAMRQFALAMELPFVLVGAVVVGGFFGYLLDDWLGTRPALLLAGGGVGFFAGVREVLRRLARGKRERDDSTPQP